MTKILIISGKKQSGKSSAARFIAGDILKRKGMIKHRDMDDEGNLLVNAWVNNDEGEKEEKMGIFPIDLNIYEQSPELSMYLHHEIYPKVKIYSLADPLKEMLVEIFGISPQQVYGTDAQKNSNTVFNWDDFRFVFSNKEVAEYKDLGFLSADNQKSKKISSRKIMEIVGTKIFRRIKPDCWLQNTLKRIETDAPEFAIIADGRFPDEIEAVHKVGGYSLRLHRDLFNSKSEPEVALDGYKKFSVNLHNQDFTIKEKNQRLVRDLEGLGFLEVEVGAE